MADPVSLGVTIALNAASMALTASQQFEGPRLDNLKVTNSDYGAPLKSFMGTRMLEGLSVIFAEDIREEEHQNKTKGGKYNNFTYFGTWAALIADHAIDQVLQVWFDEHLVYDVTGAGPVSPFSLDDGTSITDFMRFYLGGPGQEPDPRMLATIEAEHGAGSCPDFADVSYIMFEELPLEKLGNRLPQIKVLATRNPSATLPYESHPSPIGQPSRLWGFTFSPDGSRLIYGTFDNYVIWDVATRSPIRTGTMTDAMDVQEVFGWARDGRLWYAGDEEILGGHLHGLFGGETYLTSGMPFGADGCTVKSLGVGYPEFLVAYGQATTEIFGWLRLKVIGDLDPPILNYIDTTDVVAGGFTVTTSFVDDNGDLWVGGVKQGGSQTSAHFMRVTALGAALGVPPVVNVTGLPALTLPDVSALWCDGKIVFSWDAKHLYQVNPVGGAILNSISPFSTDVYNTAKQFENFVPGQKRLWLNITADALEIDLTDLSLVRTIDTSLWHPTDSADGIIYDRLNHALITAPDLLNQTLAWRYLDRASGGGVQLQDIIEAVSEMCGLDIDDDIDASALDQELIGFSWIQATGRQILEPLLEGFGALVRPHDFKLQFLKRGGASSGSIPVTDMRAGAGAAQGDRYKVIPATDTDLPRRAFLTHADPEISQQPNTVPAQRNAAAVDGVREMTLDLSNLAVSADDGRAMIDAWLRRTWYNAMAIENAVSRKHGMALEPGDHKVLELDAEHKTGELTAMTVGANGVFDLKWRRDGPSIHVAPTQAGAPADGIDPPVMPVFTLSQGFVLDIPLTKDVDDGTNPVLYYGAGPYSDDTAFPGAQVYRSDDGAAYATFASVAAASALTWGYANGALATASANVWDRGNSVSVTVKRGSLTSQTEAAIDANPMLNQALLGSEILQFATATLVSSDSSGKVYTLSGFKRGRRGTEGFVATHAAGDQLVLLDKVGDAEMGASDIGDTLYFKAVTNGRTLASADVLSLAPYAANSHKPYAPAIFRATKDPSSGDWVFTWRRRSRIGYRWTGASSVPLGESTESYKVDIYNGASVVRTLTVSSQTATWTAAQQTTDFGSGQSSVTARVRQLGALVEGRETAGSF